METVRSVCLDVPGYADHAVTCQDHSYSRADPSHSGCPTGVVETTIITVVPDPRKIGENKQVVSSSSIMSSTSAVSFLQQTSLNKVQKKEQLRTQMPPRRSLPTDPIVN